ncbi:MAG: hypothetical protein E4G74_03190, partial [Erysipelotrichales bacterium]
MKKKPFFLIMTSLLIFMTACTVKKADPDTHTQASLARFRVGEIQNYKGKILSPAIGPRDNSISGVQHLEIQ